MTDLKRCLLIFVVGAVGYCVIELIWRGRTHPSMAFLGGVCLLMIYWINKTFLDKPYVIRAVFCAVGISAVEFAAGIVLNRVLKLGVWDYSRQPLNILGQICPLYSVYWFLLSLAVIFLGNKLYVF